MATNNNNNEGIIARVSSTISESQIVNHGKKAFSTTSHVTGRLLKSTGKAAWYAGTTFLILFVPVIIQMDREQQMSDF